MYHLRRKVISSTKLSCFSHSSKSRFGRYLRTQTFLGLRQAFRSVLQECVTLRTFAWEAIWLRNGPLEKLWGGGGEFSSLRNFFPYQIPCMNFFRP